MPLTHQDDRNEYAIRGTSEAVRKLLEKAWVIKSGPSAEAGWDRLVADFRREALLDRTLFSADGPAGIVQPGVSVNWTYQKEAATFVFLNVSEPEGEITVRLAEDDAQIEVAHMDHRSDALFAKILAAALLFTSGERFELRYGVRENSRVVRPELLLSRHLLERLEFGEIVERALSEA